MFGRTDFELLETIEHPLAAARQNLICNLSALQISMDFLSIRQMNLKSEVSLSRVMRFLPQHMVAIWLEICNDLFVTFR